MLVLGAGIWVVLLGGCATWQPLALSPEPEYWARPGELRVTLEDGSSLELDEGYLTEDAVVGILDGEEVAYPLAGVREVERRETNGALVNASVMALTVVGLVATWAVLPKPKGIHSSEPVGSTYP